MCELKIQLEKEEEGKGSEESKVIIPKIMCDALLSICTVEKVDARDAQAIAMATLLPAHHTYIGKMSLNLVSDLKENNYKKNTNNKKKK